MVKVDENNFPIIIFACLPYQKYISLEKNVKDSKKMKALEGVLDILNEKYSPPNPEKTLYTFTFMVKKEYQNSGLSSFLYLDIMKKAIEGGYEMLVGDALNKMSVKAGERMGNFPVAEVFYRSYREEDGTQPFLKMTPSKVVRMVKIFQKPKQE